MLERKTNNKFIKLWKLNISEQAKKTNNKFIKLWKLNISEHAKKKQYYIGNY